MKAGTIFRRVIVLALGSFFVEICFSAFDPVASQSEPSRERIILLRGETEARVSFSDALKPVSIAIGNYALASIRVGRSHNKKLVTIIFHRLALGGTGVVISADKRIVSRLLLDGAVCTAPPVEIRQLFPAVSPPPTTETAEHSTVTEGMNGLAADSKKIHNFYFSARVANAGTLDVVKRYHVRLFNSLGASITGTNLHEIAARQIPDGLHEKGPTDVMVLFFEASTVGYPKLPYFVELYDPNYALCNPAIMGEVSLSLSRRMLKSAKSASVRGSEYDAAAD